MDAYSKQISRPGRHEYDDERADLADLVNVGRAVAGYFERVGITRTAQLAGRDPIELYEQMSAACGEALDPCLLDTVMSAVDQAEGRPARPWWHYTPQRKRLLAGG
ncbi:Pathogenicity locus [Actinomadura meyerae]|uniref:Pathogenicity locus n=1 Tax=Actinomadura meyerae TaxID=240840 RepID=A0A239M8N3_9ACTN|nr:helix-hairpin-helix domain-containing protein [Actinomadura meyerae]SNT39021.1 Pathogenicity locus [Actinomadura meyerae]